MSEQSGTEKGRERLWMCCMGVYCLTLFLVLLGFLLMEYCAEETALELSAYQDLQSSPDIYWWESTARERLIYRYFPELDRCWHRQSSTIARRMGRSARWNSFWKCLGSERKPWSSFGR